jgi:hypothetical protein
VGREPDERSDAFGSAYPYNRRVRPMELYVERTSTSPRSLWGTRVGRYRAPFGLYNRSDHAYTGFLRAPLIRYGGYWAVSNNFLETGASVVAGTPRVFGRVQPRAAAGRRRPASSPRVRSASDACRPASAT